jgi:NADPH:quinone reductase-like Zn-dependent oxidoreductase
LIRRVGSGSLHRESSLEPGEQLLGGCADDTGPVRAVTRTVYGGPGVLSVAEIPAPTPAAHEILVRVHATTVNRTDCAILRAKPFVMRFGTGLRRPKSPLLGTDFAGEVVQTGSGVTEYIAGDRVWGFDDNGLASQAQFLTIAQDAAVAKIPPGIDDAQAAASAEGAHYALNALKRAGYVPGQRVCVYGATGAIGSAAVQLLAHQESDVTAFCGGEHADLVRGLGATTVVDHTTQELATYPDRFDLVLDAVGKTTFAASKPLLGNGGRYVSSELGPHGQNLYLALTTRLRPGPTVHFPLPTGRRHSIHHMTGLLASGRFRPLIDRHFPLEHARSAYEYVLTGQKLGNVILDVR